MTERKYFFDSPERLVAYLEAKLDNPTPLKIQKSLYLFWAYYASIYGSIDYSIESEFTQIAHYPKRLFPATFKAGLYGPFVSDILNKEKGDTVKPNAEIKPKDQMEKDVWFFIDGMIKQVNPVSDFSLVVRTCQDKAWQKAIKNEEDIIKDYQKYANE